MRTRPCTPRTVAGRLAKAEEFQGTAELLARVDRRRSGDLRTLLSNKSRISYSERTLPDSVFLRVQRAATRLVEAARAI